MLLNIFVADAVGCSSGCGTCPPCVTGCYCDHYNCVSGQTCCNGTCISVSCSCSGGQGRCDYRPSPSSCPACACYDPKCKYCDPITGPQDIKILAINGPNTLPPGGYGDYSISTIPGITPSSGYTVVWSGGDDYRPEMPPPMTWIGIGWNTCGTKTITVVVNGCVTKTKTVEVGCDAKLCKKCSDTFPGTCEDICTDCEECVDGSCQFCGGDLNKTCCDGECHSETCTLGMSETETLLKLGWSNFSKGSWQDAISSFEKGLAKLPDDSKPTNILYGLARMYESTGNKQKAEETYRQLLPLMKEETPQIQEVKSRIVSLEESAGE
jgi:hypothetical protein